MNFIQQNGSINTFPLNRPIFLILDLEFSFTVDFMCVFKQHIECFLSVFFLLLLGGDF